MGLLLILIWLVTPHAVRGLRRRLLLGLFHVRSEVGRFLVSDCLIAARSVENYELEGSDFRVVGGITVAVTAPVMAPPEFCVEAMAIAAS